MKTVSPKRQGRDGMKIGGPHMLFGRKKQIKSVRKSYDPETQRPVLRCSICTGEQVAGFKDIRTGKFEEITLIRDDRELREFMETYGIDKVTKEY